MQIKVNKTIGTANYEFLIDEKDPRESLHVAAVLGNPPAKCNECDNYDQKIFKLDSNKDKDGNIYINVMCRKCGAKAKLGYYKSGGYFWHKFEKYVKSDENKYNQSPPVNAEDHSQEPPNGDLPF